MIVDRVEQWALVAIKGDEVRQRREALHMTIEQLAAEASVSADTLSDFETGARRTQYTKVRKIAEALERLEEDAGITAPAARHPGGSDRDLIEVEYDGTRVFVRGPVADRDAIAEMASRLIREARKRDDAAPDTD